jgi:hypothetical protein
MPNVNQMVITLEAARLRGISSQRMRFLCAEGRVRGAVKMGRQWLIPTPVTVSEVRRGRPPMGA